LNLQKFEIFPTSAGENRFSRAIAMPYGMTWGVLNVQEALAPLAGSLFIEECVANINRIRTTVAELPQSPKEPAQVKQIPLYLRQAITSGHPQCAIS
jgi:hypothetical protein